MSKTQLSVLFKKIQKDDKKEVLEFHVQGDNLPNSTELVEMAGGISILEIEENGTSQIEAEFKSIQRDSKKTTLKFEVKGDSGDQLLKLYPLAGSNVTLLLQPSQMSIDEFYDEDQHNGLDYDVHSDGTVEVKGQIGIFDEVEDEVKNEDDEDVSNVVPFGISEDDSEDELLN